MSTYDKFSRVNLFTSDKGFTRGELNRVLTLVGDGTSTVHVRTEDAHFFTMAISKEYHVTTFFGLTPADVPTWLLDTKCDSPPTVSSQGSYSAIGADRA